MSVDEIDTILLLRTQSLTREESQFYSKITHKYIDIHKQG